MTGWRRWLPKLSRTVETSLNLGIQNSFGTLPCPETPVAVIGDIHGRVDLLRRMLVKLSGQAPGVRQVFVGDYIDRGPDSYSVLEELRNLDQAVCLCGNHEVMLLEFLDSPIELGGRWLRNGGINTLESFGIKFELGSDSDAIVQASRMLGQELANGTKDWLRNLPLSWKSGNLLVTHAGPDPSRPISGQKESNFLWGHNRFLRDNRKDGVWVAHGHWARDVASVGNGRIGVDTGAWKSGQLTAALISTEGNIQLVVVN